MPDHGQADRGAGRSLSVSPLILWPAGLVVAAVVVILWAYAVVREHQLRELQDEVRRDCRGVVAALDLSEWVPVCRQLTGP